MRLSSFLSHPLPDGPETIRPFIKMHGLGNHFVIFDQRKTHWDLKTDDVVRICDVRYGVGAEQVLAIQWPSAQAKSSGAYAAVRIFNVDGREVGACGNASRCIAYLLFDEAGSEELWLETKGGLLHCRKTGKMEASVKFGPISMSWERIPLSKPVDTSHLPIESGPLRDGLAFNIGNPHAVFFVDDLDRVDVAAVAPAIQSHPLFPEGVNVGVAQVLDFGTLRLAVWERPGILTGACGTGACVAAFAGRLRGFLTVDNVVVHFPAGRLGIKLERDGMVIMTGPVAFCCCGFV